MSVARVSQTVLLTLPPLQALFGLAFALDEVSDGGVDECWLLVDDPVCGVGDAVNLQVWDELLEAVEIAGQQVRVLLTPDDQRRHNLLRSVDGAGGPPLFGRAPGRSACRG